MIKGAKITLATYLRQDIYCGGGVEYKRSPLNDDGKGGTGCEEPRERDIEEGRECGRAERGEEGESEKGRRRHREEDKQKEYILKIAGL